MQKKEKKYNTGLEWVKFIIIIVYTIYSNSMKIPVLIIHDMVNTSRHVHNMDKNSKHFRQSCKHKPNYESMNININRIMNP